MTEPINREPVNDWHSDLDHFDPDFVADPYPIYEDLRGQCPVAHSDRYGGMTWLTKASDVAAAANATDHPRERGNSSRIREPPGASFPNASIPRSPR